MTIGEANPGEATNALIDDLGPLVEDAVLKSGQAKGLMNPLENALRSLEKEYTADACNQYADFIMEVAREARERARPHQPGATGVDDRGWANVHPARGCGVP